MPAGRRTRSSPRSAASSSAVPTSPSSVAQSSPITPSSEFDRPQDEDDYDDPINAEEEDDEGEDLMENMQDDYRQIPELDRYEREGIDEDDQSPMQFGDRQAAEDHLRKRDREAARRLGRDPNAFMESEEEGEDEEERARPRRRRQAERAAIDLPDYDDDDEDLNIQDRKGPLREWIVQDDKQKAIASQFARFLKNFTDSKGNNVYKERIMKMCGANRETLEVSYFHLGNTAPTLAVWVADAPTEMLKIFDQVALKVVLVHFPNYQDIRPEIHVRITDLPVGDSLRDLRQVHLNGLIKVSGVVTRRTGVFPQLKYVKYDCVKCGYLLGPYSQSTTAELKIGSCPECQSKGPFFVNSEQTIYRNYQKVTLQESPGTVPAGRLPRQKDVILTYDLIDVARPGEEIEVTGVYNNNFDANLNLKNGFPVFSTVIEANFISKREDPFRDDQMTEDDKNEIRKLAEDPNIGRRIIQSLAPSIFGHEHVKTCVALSMFGGTMKDIHGKHRIRGDINVLLLGDPGTAKSQLLKYVEKTSPRAVFTTGKGASAVGLTASVHRDPITREWVLEGGALVLADRGVCLIDEFDKMNDADRTSIHEAMEQQSISISKAGIVTNLQARCCVIAAANPVKGRYDQSMNFASNVDLTEPILSRFDCLCVLKDLVDPVNDENLAKFVVGSHMKSHPNKSHEQDDDAPVDKNIIPHEVLRKYIMYARREVTPKLHQIDEEKIMKLYADLRRESMIADGQMIAVRHLESIIRLSEANARMHLRDYVRDEDTDMAIRTVLESFISTQKFSAMRSLKKVFQKYMAYKRDNNDLLLHILQGLVKNHAMYLSLRRTDTGPVDIVEIDCEDFESKAREISVYDLTPFYESEQFEKNNFVLTDSRNKIVKRF